MNEPERPLKDPAKEAADAKRAVLITLMLVPVAFALWLLLQWHELFAFTRIPDRSN
jgi:hypothetical protein